MIELKNKEECCGCTSCKNICPVRAIEMKQDFEGFSYPSVDKDKCVECGLCNKVCPILNKCTENSVYGSCIGRSKDKDILMEGSSGGVMTALGNHILSKGGVVCGEVFDKEFRVVHKIISDASIPETFRGSKYVQSDMNDCFSEIKKLLQKGIEVCFVGTTCQVEGLKAFLQKDYENLYSIDLVCHGTPSPKLWEKYKAYQCNKYGSQIKHVNFRNKTYGYHSGTMKIVFENGKVYNGSARVDYMLKSFFKEIASRPSCYECKFKTLGRVSDLTVYDCWHPSELVPEINDDDCGYTNIIIQSAKGMEWLDSIKTQVEIYPCDTEKAIALDGIMVRESTIPHPKRGIYYTDLDNHTLPEHINMFIPVTVKDHIIEKMKIIVYRMGILNYLKK